MAQTKPKAGQFYGVSDNGTDGQFLKTDGTGGMSWVSTIVDPTITSIDYPGTQTAADPAGGESVIINGTLFASGITCTVGGTSAVTAFNSATQITITTPAKAAGQYTVVVTNPDGGTVSQVNFIQYSGVPVWSTASGNIGSVQSGSTASFQVTATEGSDTIEYAVTTGSLPTGLSLATATGAITGTAGSVSASTTTTFSITATDDENQTSSARSFNITVTPDVPSNHFTPVIWSGNGSSTRSISTGFESDMIWIKSRNYVNNHFLIDSVRGKDGGTTYENVYPNTNSPQANDSGITAIGSTSFTTGNSRFASNDWVAWAWKAGGAPVANTDGTITSQVSANTTLGFSISKYTGNGTSGATFGHGLGSQVNISMVKRTDSAGYWYIYSSFLSANNNLYLNTSDAQQPDGVMLGGNTTTVSISASSSVNASGGEYIAYNFASKPGFSKVGSYTGTGASGNLVVTGFEPAFIMIKSTSSSNTAWNMWDNKRTPYDMLRANTNEAEFAGPGRIQFFANGFQLLDADASRNSTGGNYIYLAFAADGSTTTPSLANSFATEIYSGTNSNHSITTGFKPDLIWMKNRSISANHALFDSVRGTEILYSNLTNAQSSWDSPTFDSNGFTLSGNNASSSLQNASGSNYVSWNWKAGGLASINTDGTITSLVSANQAAGFSVVKYNGNSNSGTVGHGLSQTPELFFIKTLSMSAQWLAINTSSQTGGYLSLTDSFTTTRYNAWLNNANPTNTIIPLGAYNYVSGDMIMYCFTSIAGYSKVGSYTGNGSTSGPTITTGFEPGFLMIKKTNGTAPWFIFDSARNPSNNRNKFLNPNEATTEGVGGSSDYVSFNSTNFTLTSDPPSLNGSGGTYIYLAIKEN